MRKGKWGFYVWWSFSITHRMNGTMWGYDPYVSYRFGPIEVRKYSHG